MAKFVAIIDRFEGDVAVLKHDGHDILLPKSDLPEGTKEGDLVSFVTSTQGKATEKKRRSEMIKRVINDVLGATIGNSIVEQTPEEKEIDRLGQISEKMDNLNAEIREDIHEHHHREEDDKKK